MQLHEVEKKKKGNDVLDHSINDFMIGVRFFYPMQETDEEFAPRGH